MSRTKTTKAPRPQTVVSIAPVEYVHPSNDLAAESRKATARLSAECDLLLKLLQVQTAAEEGHVAFEPDTLPQAIASISQLIELSQTLLTGITDDLVNR